MYVSNTGHSPIHGIDPDRANPAVRGQERPVQGAPVPTPQASQAVPADTGLMAERAPEGADPKLWEMLGPAERAYLSGSFDRLGLGGVAEASGGSMGRGVYVDLRV